MKRLIVLGALLIVAVELLALAVRDHRLILAASGVTVALAAQHSSSGGARNGAAGGDGPR